MKAHELRIGNLIMFGEFRHECKPDDIANLYKDQILNYESDVYQPIELTDEWMIKFGFKRYATGAWCKDIKDEQTYLAINTQYEDGVWLIVDINGNENTIHLSHIEYVHQLQNLYFALTGQELKC